MKQLQLVIVFLLLCLPAGAQDLIQYDRLRLKGDSAYDYKDWAAARSLYEQALQLPAGKKPEELTSIYYDIACVYSLLNEKDKALDALEQSFANAKRFGSRHASASHLGRDRDLANVREDPGFKQFLKMHFPGLPLENFLSKEISYHDLLELVEYLSVETRDPIVIIADKTIFWEKKEEKFTFNRNALPFPKGDALKTKSIWFANCTFQLNFIWNGFMESSKQPFIYAGIEFEDCRFEGRFFWDKVDFVIPPRFSRSHFADDFYLLASMSPVNMFESYVMDNCSVRFAYASLATEKPIGVELTNNTTTDSMDFRFNCNNVSAATISGNHFGTKNIAMQLDQVDVLKINDNEIGNLVITGTEVQTEFDLQRTNLSGQLVMKGTYFSNEPANDIEWTETSHSSLALLQAFEQTDRSRYNNIGLLLWAKRRPFTVISGEDPASISDREKFSELMGLYSMFLNLYKNKNDLESYNKCYVAIKEYQSKRLKFLYESNKTFESYFRWKLSQLLKYYVRHGTDPARAIVISIYIISIFGTFFFFFPSDWDVTSKKRLIENFKDFAQKNDKGYIKPFFILIWGFVISLLNAFTLSLNAFITLGFGNIPTHGAARYVCVLEGFLGWFLLSIFTVALINQVL